ncbi:MAG: DEAD/DEAH box helicase family protein [Clostridiales bacterium]|jgi:superfamily II DNA or RNA helicase|nr:DEAD/DEAH box helicase family protein [Clostridiales bacterium]
MKPLNTKRPCAEVEVRNGLLLSGFPEEDLARMKKQLTFGNPLYEKTRRFSPYARTNIDPYLYYYARADGGKLAVPLGTDIDSVASAKYRVVDARSLACVERWGGAEFAMELRGEQRDAFAAWERANRSWANNGVIQMKTGKGKSVLALYIAKHLGLKTLIVVHKDDLAKGWREDIASAFTGMPEVGLIKAKAFEIGELITIATVQTLQKYRDDRPLFQAFGLVIQDEAHHAPSASFSLVGRFESRYKLALTATPERSDGLSHIIQLYYGGTAYSDKAARSGDADILPVEVRQVAAPAYFNPIYTNTMELRNGRRQYHRIKSRREEREADQGYRPGPMEIRHSELPYMDRPNLAFSEADDATAGRSFQIFAQDIAREWGEGHSCVAFFTKKEHCRAFGECLGALGIECGLYYGDNSEAQNDETLRRAMAERRFVTVTTYAKATEGTNCPQWECAFLCSSIGNGKNVEQVSGRIRRKHGSKLPVARLYDYSYPGAQLTWRHLGARLDRYKELGFRIASDAGARAWEEAAKLPPPGF